jgi:hypothetical protein
VHNAPGSLCWHPHLQPGFARAKTPRAKLRIEWHCPVICDSIPDTQNCVTGGLTRWRKPFQFRGFAGVRESAMQDFVLGLQIRFRAYESLGNCVNADVRVEVPQPLDQTACPIARASEFFMCRATCPRSRVVMITSYFGLSAYFNALLRACCTASMAEFIGRRHD